MSYTLTLDNGRVVTGAEFSGNTWITSQEVSAETFSGGLSAVKVSGTDPAEGESDPRGEYENLRLDGIYKLGERTCFVLSESRVTEAERLRSDVDYMAMMLGVEL